MKAKAFLNYWMHVPVLLPKVYAHACHHSVLGSLAISRQADICLIVHVLLLLALEATQLLKNPIIIDHTYAQPWQMKDYIGLVDTSNCKTRFM